MPKTPVDEVLRRLMEESYGALAWLRGSVQLSNRARIYKVRKLQKALAVAEEYLLKTSIDDLREENVLRKELQMFIESLRTDGPIMAEPLADFLDSILEEDDAEDAD